MTQKEDLLNDEELNTYDKGKELENQFAIFMKHELEWSKARVGAHMAGKSNVKGAAIDIIGERLDDKGIRFKRVFNYYFFIGACLVVFSLTQIIFENTNNDWFEILLNISVVFLVLGLFCLIMSNKYNIENAWVECKNLKGKANINHIEKSIREINDYNASDNNEYKFKYWKYRTN